MGRSVHWIGSSLDDLKGFDIGVRKQIGHGLHIAQHGGQQVTATPLTMFAPAKVIEIEASGKDTTYRCVYLIQYPEAVYVLHVFNKKSTKGKAIPTRDVRLIKGRIKDAEIHHEQEYGDQEGKRERQRARRR